MGVFDFGDDDLEPFPRKVPRIQAHAIGSVKDAICSTVPRRNHIGQHKREEIFKTDDRLSMDGLAQEDLKCNLPLLKGTVEAEVIVCGEDLILSWGTIHVSGVEFKFTTDAIALKFVDDCGDIIAINLPLNDITGFDIRTCQQTRSNILGLTLTEIGTKLLEHKIKNSLNKRVLSCDEDFTLATRIENLGGSGLARKITSLCDRYKVLWRPGQLNSGTNPLEWGGCRNIEIDRSTWLDLIYPKGDSDAVTVTLDDFLLLNPCEFISDTIVDFYIKYLQNKLPEREKERLHFFNSFFFRKLVNLDTNLEQTGSTFEHIRRWTRDVNIFNKDFLFIPIMQSAHWSLIIVCHPGQLFKQDLHGSKGSLIVHFDSMEGFHKGVEAPIEKYLIEQWTHQFSAPFPNTGTSIGVNCLRAKVPQQTNFSDCGLFMLHYVEMFLQALESSFPKIQVSRDWFNPEDVASKRSILQRLLRTMQEEELQVRASLKHVDISLEEPASGSVRMQGSPMVVKADASGNNIYKIEGESTKKAAESTKKAVGPYQFILLPERSTSQEKDASSLDDVFQQTSAFSSSSYGRGRCPSYPHFAGENSLRELSSDAIMKATHPMHLCTKSHGKVVIDVGEDLTSKETTIKVHETQCSGSSTLTGLGKVHDSYFKSESNLKRIAEDSAKVLSNSAFVEFTHSMHLLAESSKRHVMITCEDAVSREVCNRKHETRQSVKSASNSLHSNRTQTSNMCASLPTIGSDSKMECLVSDVSTDSEHCDNGAIPPSRLRCSWCSRHETSDDYKASPDIRLENCIASSNAVNEASCLKSSNSAEGHRQAETQSAGTNSQAQGAIDPLCISSDEETGFVKVQKIVEASKARRIVRLQNRQKNLSSLKSARGAIARDVAEGTENQPPNARWRLRRRSQMFLS